MPNINSSSEKNKNTWLALCFDGSKGLESLIPV